MSEPRPVAGGGELLVTGIMLGNEKQRPVPRFSYHASRAPPPTSQIIIIPKYDISKDIR